MNFASAPDFTFSEKSLFCEIQFGLRVCSFWRQILFYTLLVSTNSSGHSSMPIPLQRKTLLSSELVSSELLHILPLWARSPLDLYKSCLLMSFSTLKKMKRMAHAKKQLVAEKNGRKSLWWTIMIKLSTQISEKFNDFWKFRIVAPKIPIGSLLSCNAERKPQDLRNQQPIFFVFWNALYWTSPRECFVDFYNKHLNSLIFLLCFPLKFVPAENLSLTFFFCRYLCSCVSCNRQRKQSSNELLFFRTFKGNVLIFVSHVLNKHINLQNWNSACKQSLRRKRKVLGNN